MRTKSQIKSEIRAVVDQIGDIDEKVRAGKIVDVAATHKQLDELGVKMAGLNTEYSAAEAWETKRSLYMAAAVGAADANPNGDFASFSNAAFTGKATGRQLAPIGLPEVAVKALWDAMRSSSSIEVKAAGDTTDLGGAPGLLPLRVPPLLTIHEPTRLADHIPARAVGAPVIEYVEVTGSEVPAGVAALVTAPGALKPAIHLLSAVRTTTVTKIAALMKLMDESTQDFPTFMQIVSSELNRVVIDAENQQLLNGLGTLGSIKGLNTYVAGDGVIVRPKATDSRIDALEQAMLDMRSGASFCEPELYVMNPTDWSKVRREKDLQGRYLVNPDPTQAGATQLWGLPVVVTTAQPAGKVLVLAPSIGLELFVRESLGVRGGFVDDDFQRNLTSLICEERLALAVTRPSTIVQVTGF